MNAIVEVTTAEVVVQMEASEVVVTTTVANYPKVIAPVVVTSTQRVLKALRYSIDALAPNYILMGGTA